MDVSISNLKSKVLVKITGSVKLTEAEALRNPFEKVLETATDIDTLKKLTEKGVILKASIKKLEPQ